MTHLTQQELLIAVCGAILLLSVGWVIYIVRLVLADIEVMFLPTTRDQGTEIDYYK